MCLSSLPLHFTAPCFSEVREAGEATVSTSVLKDRFLGSGNEVAEILDLHYPILYNIVTQIDSGKMGSPYRMRNEFCSSLIWLDIFS
jgi:hypothetical protein